jgi:glycosyltransferase involved in cell wall biosynthesis
MFPLPVQISANAAAAGSGLGVPVEMRTPEEPAPTDGFAPGVAPRLRILVLADRDWTHPQGGGTGANLFANVIRWARWGHEVTVVTGEYPGCRHLEQAAPNLVVHRMGGRGSVFPRAAWAVLRGVGRDADVVFEVINGIVFLTPVWLRKPRVALVNHPHRDLYIGEFGPRLGRVMAALFEELPLRLLYRRVPFVTLSGAARDELVSLDRVPRDHITLAYCGVGPGPFGPGERAPDPRLLYVGRLKAYKRIELLLDMLVGLPGVTLDIAGQGDHGETLDEEIGERGLASRVRVHGYVDEQAKADLYRQAWVHVTASASEGWSLTVMEAALCATPSAALAVGGLRESIVHDHTGLLAQTPQELTSNVQRLLADEELRERLGAAARERALTFTWERAAATTLSVVQRRAARVARRRARAARA